MLSLLLLVSCILVVHAEHQQRNLPTKKHHTKPKLHYTSHAAHLETKYGIDLPSFAFDYSEYFSGAVIERSSKSKDLYLTMFLMGHQAISTDFPFQAISTDEEVLHSWTKATKKWEKAPTTESQSKTGAPHRQLNSQPGSQSFHASHNTGLVCLLQNNDVTPSIVYQTTAYWVQAQSDMDSSSGHNIFSILRCKLRSPAHMYSNATQVLKKQLFVDVMRMNPHKNRSNRTSTALPATPDGASSNTADGNIAADARGTVLSSFSVPWSTRVVGYPFSFHSNASAIDPWRDPPKPHAFTHGAVTTTTKDSGSPNSAAVVDTAVLDSSTILCVPGVRPLHPLRAEVGLPMLIEFIEHHLLLDFHHIVLGIALDWKSSFMTKHLHALHSYIQSGKVSLYSTTIAGFDDVQGFGGIKLKDAYAEQYFLNQCLYYAKGMARYVTVLHIDEFIMPLDTSGATGVAGDSSNKLTFVQDAVRRFSTIDTSNSSVESAVGTQQLSKGHVAVQSHCTYSFLPIDASAPSGGQGNGGAESTAAHTGTVQAPLRVYGIEDPANVFGAWGPGESTWSRDFFAPCPPKLLHKGVHSIQFLPTDRVVRIEVSSTRETISHCRSVASQKGRSTKTSHSLRGSQISAGDYNAASINAHASGTNSANAAAGVTGHSKRYHGPVSYTGSGVLRDNLAALFVYKGAFASNLFAPAEANVSPEGAKLLSAAVSSRQALNSRIISGLQAKNMSTIAELKALVKQSRIIHIELHPTVESIMAAEVTKNNPNSTPAGANKNQVIVELPTRAAIKPPFWQLCNTDYLRDVIKKVFHHI